MQMDEDTENIQYDLTFICELKFGHGIIQGFFFLLLMS